MLAPKSAREKFCIFCENEEIGYMYYGFVPTHVVRSGYTHAKIFAKKMWEHYDSDPNNTNSPIKNVY